MVMLPSGVRFVLYILRPANRPWKKYSHKLFLLQSYLIVRW